MVALDATNSSSPGLKLLRSYLNNTRMEFFKVTRFIFSVKLYIYHTSSIILEEMLSHHSLIYAEIKITEQNYISNSANFFNEN